MSMLKHLDADGHIVDDETSPPLPSPADARIEAERGILGHINRMDDAFMVNIRRERDRADRAEAELRDLQQAHDELVARYAEAKRKLEILHDLKQRLDGV